MKTFYVWNEDDGPECQEEIESASEDDAVCKWAENKDVNGAEYRICGHGESVTVVVYNKETEEKTRWIVQGECVAQYWADQVFE